MVGGSPTEEGRVGYLYLGKRYDTIEEYEKARAEHEAEQANAPQDEREPEEPKPVDPPTGPTTV